MPPKRKCKRGDDARRLQSTFVTLDRDFLDHSRALAAELVLERPIQPNVALFEPDVHPDLPQPTLPKRPRWRYDMSKEELDANEQAAFRAWLMQQDALVKQWQDLAPDHPMPRPPTHCERNIEVWRQFWRVTEISQILLVLLDSRCPPLHLPPSLVAHLAIATPRTNQPPCILVLTKVDISGPERTASWTSFLAVNYPGVPVVPVEAYAPIPAHQGRARYEPHLPGTFRERLVHTLGGVHQQLLLPPHWVTAPRAGEGEQDRLDRIGKWTPRVKRAIDWEAVLKAKGKQVGKAVGGAAASKEDEEEFLTIGVLGQPNVGKSSLLNALFGATRVRASRTPGKTKHFQTLFWTSDVRLVDCPGLVMPSFVPMDIQVLSGILPISQIAAVPFCVHQLACLLPLEQILELTHPSAVAAPTVEDKRTWRPGQRPPEQSKVVEAKHWTTIDIMTAYANKKGWVTAKAGRPDIHRAGNAILRLVAEGKIPWAFWPPGSSVSGDCGIWLKDGAQQIDEHSEEEMSKEESKASLSEEEEEEEEEDERPRGWNLGRFGALSVE